MDRYRKQTASLPTEVRVSHLYEALEETLRTGYHLRTALPRLAAITSRLFDVGQPWDTPNIATVRGRTDPSPLLPFVLKRLLSLASDPYNVVTGRTVVIHLMDRALLEEIESAS